MKYVLTLAFVFLMVTAASVMSVTYKTSATVDIVPFVRLEDAQADTLYSVEAEVMVDSVTVDTMIIDHKIMYIYQ